MAAEHRPWTAYFQPSTILAGVVNITSTSLGVLEDALRRPLSRQSTLALGVLALLGAVTAASWKWILPFVLGGKDEAEKSQSSHPDDLADRDIIECNEVYEEVDGQFVFKFTAVVYQDRDEIYTASLNQRQRQCTNIKKRDLFDIALIPTPAYRPLFSPGLTRAPEPLPKDCYVKRPSLISYREATRKDAIANDFLQEVKVCEFLKRHPHPNIAKYLGCQVLDGRIVGICFPRYGQTLGQKYNPQSCGKRHFSSSRGDLGDTSNIFNGVQSGLDHLHSLGLVHNDLNPHNVMLEGHTPIIIDFGSCRREGESLKTVGQTPGWHDEAVCVSLATNDLDALEEMRIWTGDSDKAYQFEEP